jgi:hypothetical protein
MTGDLKKRWGTPTLEAIDIRDTAVKGNGPNESGQVACGPAQSGGTPNCS